MTKNSITTIQISKETHDRLANLGSKHDTFEFIVKRLLDEVEKK
ncbi:MAG: hypothetical protein HW410_1516 [Nitrosarchaeum sp.]|nr:hypothetical protein [Nitrosarchaeum sp.]